MSRAVVLLTFMLLFWTGLARSAELRVPQDYLDLHSALDAASRCDTISMDSGMYSGPAFREIYLGSKRCIWIRSKYGAKSTTIDLQGSYFCDGEPGTGRDSNNIIIQGLRFIHGNPAVNYCPACEVAIFDCVFDSCEIAINAGMYGGYYLGGVFRSSFVNNDTAIFGNVDAWLTIGDCLFLKNVESVIGRGFPSYYIYNCSFIKNSFAAYHSQTFESGRFEGNLFYMNGIGLFSEGDSGSWADRLSCNDVFGNVYDYLGLPNKTGTAGNISKDPNLCWLDLHKVAVASISPLNSNNNSCAYRIGALSPIECYCGDVDVSGNVDIADVTAIISYLYLSGPPPNPIVAGEIDGIAPIDIADLSRLIDYLYISFNPLPCGT